MSLARQNTLPHLTADEFWEWQGELPGEKFELVDGELRAMSPASSTHGNLQSKLASIIDQLLANQGKGCWVATEPAVRPRLRADVNLRVPDLGVTCQPNEPRQLEMPSPVLLVEILSPGNKGDTWENVRAYATIPTVVEVLVVESTRIGAFVLRKGADGAWPELPEIVAVGGRLRLTSIGLDCPIADLYVNTHLARG